MLAVSKSEEVRVHEVVSAIEQFRAKTSDVAAENAAAAVEAAERANAQTAPTMSSLYEEWLALREASAAADRTTRLNHDRAVAVATAVAPAVVWTAQDFYSFGGAEDWVGKPVKFHALDWLDKWMESKSAKTAGIEVIVRARQIIDAELKFREALSQASAAFGCAEDEDAENAIWDQIAVVEEAICRRKAQSHADLRIKALVAMKQFPTDDDVDQTWQDACALSVLRDVLELTQ